MYLNLDKIKDHLNIDHDYYDDDRYIQQVERAVEAAVAKHIDVPSLDQYVDECGQLPWDMQQAILLLIGHYYQNREPEAFTSVNKIDLSYEYLLQPFKSYEW